MQPLERVHDDECHELISCMNSRGLSEVVTERDHHIIVKVDVEGHEMQVMRQLLNSAFATQIVEAFVEVNEEWLNVDSLMELMNQQGFVVEKVVGTGSHYDVLFTR